MNIVWSPTARRDLAHLRAHIQKDNPAAAQSVAQALISATRRLTEFPESGRPGRVPHTRELVVPGTPNVIPYTVRDGRVWIIAVLHAARQWPEGFGT